MNNGDHNPCVKAAYSRIETKESKIKSKTLENVEAEPAAAYECNIKILAPYHHIHKVNTGSWRIASTGLETSVNQWATHPANDGYSLMRAKCKVQESKTLIRELFCNVGFGEHYQINAKPIDSNVINAIFVPVKLAVQVDNQLGWPTGGFFYHFIDGTLNREYIAGESHSLLLKATCSSEATLSNQLLSTQPCPYILLPLEVEGTSVSNQHILYSSTKLGAQALSEVSQSWLDEHATTINLSSVVDSLEHRAMAREDNAPSPLTELVVGEAYAYHNVWGEYPKTHLLKKVEHIQHYSHTIANTPVINVKQLPKKTFRIGIFFDGTGNNRLNDEYKAHSGDKSPTNVARLFNAYPVKSGESQKVYISGVGTRDLAKQKTEQERAAIIDAGKDETIVAGATGVELKDLLKEYKSRPEYTWMNISLALNPIAKLLNDSLELVSEVIIAETSALYKWQSLIVDLYDIFDGLLRAGLYDDITNIEFDVFGFSRGASLSRHFVNAVAKGFPDYTSNRKGNDGLTITPNLLGSWQGDKYNPSEGFLPDENRLITCRFVGLFDTVGSFYIPGLEDNGNYHLALKPECAERVYQITAYHEYRLMFPLTSLRTHNQLPPNFFEDVFPGCHSDIGGGYAAKKQYDAPNLPKRYGTPTETLYNREFVKTRPFQDYAQVYFGQMSNGEKRALTLSNIRAARKNFIQQEQQIWDDECQTNHNCFGLVVKYGLYLYYYRLQPITNGLSALALLRMQQQANIVGVEWIEVELNIQADYAADEPLKQLWDELKQLKIGEINVEDWRKTVSEAAYDIDATKYGGIKSKTLSDIMTPSTKQWVHRPHDAMINPGCFSWLDFFVNTPSRDDHGKLKRKIYENT